MKTIKEIVDKALQEKGITIKKMCEDLNMPEQTLYQIFRKNSGRKSTLDKVAEYLDIKLNIQFSLETEDSTSLQKMIDYLRKENEFLRNYINEKLMVDLGKYRGLPFQRSVFFAIN